MTVLALAIVLAVWFVFQRWRVHEERKAHRAHIKAIFERAMQANSENRERIRVVPKASGLKHDTRRIS